jgi:multiple sugar transport system permease protein
MSIARAIRVLLWMITISIVGWSFYYVGRQILTRDGDGGRVTLTLLHWGDQVEDIIVDDLIKEYEKNNPHVHIKRINPGYGQFRPKLKTMMSAGTPPDIFYLQPDFFPTLATLDLIRPIDPYIEKDRAAGQAAYMEGFWPILIKAWHYDVASNAVGKGKLYALPKDFTTAVMYVNLDLFADADVKVPYDGWTWDEYEEACRKIRALNGTEKYRGRTIFGGVLEIWPDTLRNILWTYGGDFFATNPDGSVNFRDVTLDSPQAIEAMEMIRRVRLRDRTVFNATGVAKDGWQEFIGGNIGIEGPVGRWRVPRLVQDVKFRWDTVPIPYKEKRFQASQTYYTGWTMAAKTKHPDESFRLIKFLCGEKGAAQQSRAGLSIPPLISVAKSDHFLNPPTIPRHNAQVFLDAVEYARIQQVPREDEWTQICSDQQQRALQMGEADPQTIAHSIEQQWNRVLDSPLKRNDWPQMKWNWVIFITIGALLSLVTVLSYRARRERLGLLDRAQERAGFLFIAPWLIGFLALTLGPMIVSLLLSFTKWSALTPMAEAQAVGISNYAELFGNDPTFFRSLRITFYFVLLAVPVSQLAALGVALLMNSNVRGIALFRTIYFVPSVISGVALAVLWLQIFNNDYGVLNETLRRVTGIFGKEPPDWFGRDARVWAIPAFVIMGLWGVGGGMILYLAGLKGIPASLYEAATIDGAGPLRRMWNVTLPMLSPLIFYNIVMGIIGSFQIFTQAMVMTGGGPNNATLFYVLNLYRQAFEFHNMGYASAMAWVLLVIVLAVTMLVFRGSKNLVYYEGLKT